MKYIVIILFLLAGLITIAGADDSETISTEEARQIRTQAKALAKAGISESAAAEMLTAMVQNKFSNEIQNQVRNLLTTCANQGLPYEPLIGKAMEGMAKGAGEERIVRAMRAVADRYAYGNQISQKLKQARQNTNGLTDVIAGCLTAGMKSDDIKKLSNKISEQATKSQAGPETAIRTMQVARTMARRGVKSGTIEKVLSAAVKNGLSEKEMTRLQNQERHQLEGNQNSNAGGRQGSGSGGRGGSGNGGGGGGSGGGGSGGHGR